MILSSLSKDKKGEEEAGKIFFENFDLDLFLKGIGKIISKTLSDYKESPYESRLNINFIHNILCQPIYLSYYETSYSSNYEKISIANEEQTEKIIDFYIKNAPSYIFTHSVIGTEKNATDFLIANLDKYNNIDLIDKILFDYPVNKIEKIEGSYYEKEIEKFFIALIDHSFKTNNQESLNYIIYLFDSLKKQKENLNYNVNDRTDSNILQYLQKSEVFQDKFSILQTKQILTTSFFEKNTVKIKKIRM